jgi:hypothetical protein
MDQLISSVDKFPHCNRLHFSLSTARMQAIAPIVCVDVFYFSVKVVCVDGRKGWHNKTSQSERLSDQPGGATCRVTGPEKTDGSARGSWGSELRKQ